MSDKNAIALLYEYCQNKNTNISISDLIFEYDINQFGLFNCKVTLNGEVYDKKLSCKSKKAAKNEIAAYVYDELKKKDKGNNNKDQDDNRNAIAKLNEYCQDKNTKINLSDLIFDYEINKEGYFNCKVTINGKLYDKHLSCKSKKAAKNEIAEYVYECLTGGTKTNKNIFNEDIINQLNYNNISMDDITIETQECDNGYFMCLVEFKNFTDKSFISLEPKTKEELNKYFLDYLTKEDTFITKEKKKEKDFSTYRLKDYAIENEIPYKYIIESRKDYIRCTYFSLGIVIGEKKEKIIEDNKQEAKKKAKEIAENEALSTIKNFIINKEPIFPPYKNDIDINLDNKILENQLNDDDMKSNIYIQNITQNFISTSSKKEEKKYLSEINNIITNIMNSIKREKRINGSYLIKKINNYEVWNLINYEIILFVEFKIEYINYCFDEIWNKIKFDYDENILEMDKKEEQKTYEIIKKSPNKMRFRLKNGCTFCIYIGSSIYEELLTKYVSPFKSCLDIERKFIQFVILWSNLVLYQDFEEKSKEGYDYYLKEQERIFTTLALYSWDYTAKAVNKNDNRKRKHLYILSFTNLVYMLINYKSINICWYMKKNTKPPQLIDPISNRNLITSRNKFLWKVYKEYSETIYNKEERKVKLFLDEDETKDIKKFKVLFKPFIKNPSSFKCIKKVSFKITEDPGITIKTSLYHIPKETDPDHKEKLNVIFNSLQSFLLLNIYNTENSIEIQNLNNEKNDEKFEVINERLKKELKYGIKTFFKYLNAETHVSLLKNESINNSKNINKLYFILGNNTNVCIDIKLSFE